MSTFDIATLVQGALKERHRHRPMQASIIDKLIEEALLEFTSLTDDTAVPNGGARPIDTSTITGPLKPPAVAGSFVDVGSWIDDIAVGRKPEHEPSRPSLPMDVTAGNLAALEDDDLGPASPSALAGGASNSASTGSRQSALAPSMPAPLALTGSDKKSGSKVGVLVALAVLAAGVAAWFTHLIPHP